MNDPNAFGRMLVKKRYSMNMIMRILAESMSLTTSSIVGWENGLTFPSEEKLSQISEIYKIPLQEITEAWKSSKEARKKLQKARLEPKLKKGMKEYEFSGVIGRRRVLSQTNGQIPHIRYGRS